MLFLYGKWIGLPLMTRHKIAAQFGIIKRGSTEVVDNQVKSDGYLIKEVEEALNVDVLQKYLETNETDMIMLWMWMVDKIEGRPLTQANLDTTVTQEQITKATDTLKEAKPIEEAAIKKIKRGRQKKHEA